MLIVVVVDDDLDDDRVDDGLHRQRTTTTTHHDLKLFFAIFVQHNARGRKEGAGKAKTTIAK